MVNNDIQPNQMAIIKIISMEANAAIFPLK